MSLSKLSIFLKTKPRHKHAMPSFTTGFLTLEILIAMAILTITLCSVAIVSFSSQSFIIDSKNSNDALSYAQAMLEEAKNLAKVNFDSVENKTETFGIFTKKLTVTELDEITKKISAEVTWVDGDKKVDLYNIITNLSNGPAANTCSFILSGNWRSPLIHTFKLSSLWGSELPADSNGIYTITDVDAYLGKLYITTDSSSSIGVTNKQKNLFTLNLAAPTNPTFISGIDNNVNSTIGLNSLHVGETYIYTTGASPSLPQLQIFDNTFTPPKLIESFQVSSTAKGKSVFYKNNIVYLGLSNDTSGPEFFIIDVHDPENPEVLGTEEIGNDVNDIYVHKNSAYVASGNDENIKIFDISSPSNIEETGSYTSQYLPSSNSNNGNKISVLNNNIYLGRTAGTNEFYILDSSDLNNITPIGQKDLSSGDIHGLVIRGNLAFIATASGELKIFDITDPTHVVEFTSSPIQIGKPISSIDCEGNNIFVSSNDSNGNGYITTITAQ